MSKYKVGDRVKVRSDLEYGKVYGLDYATSVMAEFSGKVVTIETLLIIGKYRVKECGYNWTDEMFSGLAEEPIIDIEFEEKHKDDVMDAVRYAFHKLSGLAEEPDTFKTNDRVRLINSGKLHSGEVGRVLHTYSSGLVSVTFDENYADFFNADKLQHVDERVQPDDSPDDADTPTVAEPYDLKVGDYVRVTEQWSSYHREVGRVSYIPELSGGYCNVKFSDETCTALDFTHLEKLRDDEPIPHITLTERPEIVLQEDIEPDAVNHPAHYTQYSVEVMDTIEEVAAHYPATVAYHIGAAIKYIFRAPFKGKLVEDLKKSAYYINRAINILEDTQ